MALEIHVNDIGTNFVIELLDGVGIVDVSTATAMYIIFTKPATATIPFEVVQQTAVFDTDGTDGKIKYITIANDLDTAGTWKIQGVIHMPSGSEHSSDIGEFIVYSNLYTSIV